MGSNDAVAQSKHAYALDQELENRIRNLDQLVDTLGATRDQVSVSRNPKALDLMNDLRTKIKASYDLFRVAKLLSDPARESMFSKIRDSLNDLEASIAYHLGVKTS